MKALAGLLCLTLVVGASAQTHWARYRVFAANDREARRISDCSLGLFSEDVAIGATDVIVGPGEMPKLAALKLPTTWVSNLPNPEKWELSHPSFQDDYTNQYLRYDVIIAQYEAWRAAYPSQVSRTQIATTENGRAVWVYRLFAPGKLGSRTSSRSVAVTCGLHAREWISPSVGMYVFNNLINLLVNGSSNTGMPEATEYLFVPVMNPDGYEYCWTNNRMWRKNRRNSGGGNFGVDLNRNFSTGWGLNSGSSGSPSSDTYRGTAPFSEPETNGFQAYLDTRPPVTAFIDFHSYGQLIIWPWGYTSSPAPGASWLSAIGLLMRQAVLDSGGLNYTAAQAATALGYLVSGGSRDYMYNRYNAPSYTIELRDTGQNGFILPESQILPTGSEGWAGFKALVQNMFLR